MQRNAWGADRRSQRPSSNAHMIESADNGRGGGLVRRSVRCMCESINRDIEFASLVLLHGGIKLKALLSFTWVPQVNVLPTEKCMFS